MMPKALIICGPTAVGKTVISEKIAQKYRLPIISCDSRQLYQELGIAVAKPNALSLKTNRYYEINTCSIFEEQNLQQYCGRVSDILKKEGNVLFCGGTGFYIKALLEGIEKLPKKNERLRLKLNQLYQEKGIVGLQKEYSKINNPQKIKDLHNPHRLIRAIEIGEKEQNNTKERAPLHGYDIEIVILEKPREELYKHINSRVDLMVNEGMVEEAKQMMPHKDLNALQTVGYQEFFDYFEGKINLNEAIELVKRNTRRYAKRQLTYFKNQFPYAKCMNASDFEKIDTFVERFLQ
jgi:tRNA dimethylallyltransferase